jgi:ADP-ribose pyrophosphatase
MSTYEYDIVAPVSMPQARGSIRLVPEREIYAGRIVTLRLRDVPGRDGAVHVREIVEHAPAAAVVAVDEQQEILLVRQLRPAVGQVLLELPAGILDPGEDPVTCARRELEEETGYTADRLEPLVRFYPSPGFCTELLHVFVAQGLRECSGQPDDDEELELVRMPLAEAMQLVRRGEITDSKTVIGLLAFREYRSGAPPSGGQA